MTNEVRRRRHSPWRSVLEEIAYFSLIAFTSSTIVFFGIGLRHRLPPWQMDQDTIIFGFATSVAVVIALAILTLGLLETRGLIGRMARIAGIASIASLPVTVLAYLTDTNIRDLNYLIQIALIFALVFIFGINLQRKLSLAFSALILAATVYPSFTPGGISAFSEMIQETTSSQKLTTRTGRFVFSSLARLKISQHQITNNETKDKLYKKGGALAQIDADQSLLVDAHGDFYLIGVSDGAPTSSRLQKINSPMNTKAYEAGATVVSPFFRVLDMLVIDGAESGHKRLFVSHMQWDSAKNCVTLNIDEAALAISFLDAPLLWTTRFVSSPCIPSDLRLSNETGGRMEVLGSDILLLTVGVIRGTKWPQDMNASYGKVIQLDLNSWESKVFSAGHRNPQGLLVAGGTIWSTEHGPDGGDELNILVEGQNYGWPTSTYGLAYGKLEAYGSGDIENADPVGEHTSGVKPLYAWMPSIGVSRLVKLNGHGFRLWKDDLLIGSLKMRSLYRVRIRDEQIKSIEQIEVGMRVRDLIQMVDGSIIAWDGVKQIQLIEPSDRIFAQCSGCHGLNEEFPAHGIGPDLHGVVNREIAKFDDYVYSRDLKNIQGSWTEARLHAFLQNPQEFAPGTTMNMPGINDRDERQQIIDLLRDTSN